VRAFPCSACTATLCGALLYGTAAGAYELIGSSWARSAFPLPWSLNADGARGAQPAAAHAASVAAFDAWHQVSCAAVTLREPAALDACDEEQASDGNNRLFWVGACAACRTSADCACGRECVAGSGGSKVCGSSCGWSYGSATLGITTTTWFQGSDRITDADIQFNAQDWDWRTGTGSYCNGCIDVFSIVLHETGHFLGLGHSAVASAIMYPRYAGHPTQILDADDVRGICALYPRPGAGTGTQGAPCAATADCQAGFVCAAPRNGSGIICTAACTGPVDIGCPAGHSCRESIDGTFACFPGRDDSDLCRPCEYDADCSESLCAALPDFAVCSRTCGAGTSCPAGYVCDTTTGTVPFCLPAGGVCTGNCTGVACPASQECRAGTCYDRTLSEGESCPHGHCETGLACTGRGSSYHCRRRCDSTTTGGCPAGQICLHLSGEPPASGACADAGTPSGAGESCSHSFCMPGLVCAGIALADARCWPSCNPAAPSCSPGTTCVALGGGAGACEPGGGGPGAQDQPCTALADCRWGTLCVDTEDGRRCATDCKPSAPACPGDPALGCNPFAGGPPPGSSGGYCRGLPWQGGPEGSVCTADFDCRAGMICLRDGAEAACRIDCSADPCPDGMECRPAGTARVCRPAAPPATPQPPDGCGCDAGGASVAALGLMARRRRARSPGGRGLLRRAIVPR